MGLALDTFYPRGHFNSTSITTTPQAVDAVNPNSSVLMNGFSLASSSATTIYFLVFQRPGGGSEYFRVSAGRAPSAPLSKTRFHEFRFNFVDGVEVRSTSATIDLVSANISFFKV